jgi:hypothetical protein
MTSPALGVGVPAGKIYEECARQLARWRDAIAAVRIGSGAGCGCSRSSASRW